MLDTNEKTEKKTRRWPLVIFLIFIAGFIWSNSSAALGAGMIGLGIALLIFGCLLIILLALLPFGIWAKHKEEKENETKEITYM